MPVRLDHLLLALPDLDAGVAAFTALTGVAPAPGGSHDGYGTRNALVSLGEGLYLELVAPDPAQPLAGRLGGAIAALSRPGMLSFCLTADDFASVADQARQAGFQPQPAAPMGRVRPDGLRMDWTIQRIDAAVSPGVVPFFIDWGDTPHPADSTPPGCRLRALVVLSPDPERLRRLYAALDIPVAVEAGLRDELVASFDTPRGPVTLTGI